MRLIPGKQSLFWPVIVPLGPVAVIGFLGWRLARDFEAVRATQAQRTGLFTEIRGRLDALEAGPKIERVGPRVLLRWPSDAVAVELERTGQPVSNVVSDFKELASALPPKR